MHLILTGATGLVGTACLHEMLTNNAITRVSILSRRDVPMAEGHSKVNVIIHKDYTQYPPEMLEKLKGAKGCVWAQGVSANDVSKKHVSSTTAPFHTFHENQPQTKKSLHHPESTRKSHSTTPWPPPNHSPPYPIPSTSYTSQVTPQ